MIKLKSTEKYFLYKRLKKGSAISEMPPAMFLLLFFAIFPVVNLIFFGVVFASCIALNNLEVREAARTPNTQLAALLTSLQDNWQSSGLGKLAGVTQAPQFNISYSQVGSDPYVNVATTFKVKPLLSIPFFNNIPALSAPWSFSVSSKRVLENPNYAFL